MHLYDGEKKMEAVPKNEEDSNVRTTDRLRNSWEEFSLGRRYT